jgi:hypothetical protein
MALHSTTFDFREMRRLHCCLFELSWALMQYRGMFEAYSKQAIGSTSQLTRYSSIGVVRSVESCAAKGRLHLALLWRGEADAHVERSTSRRRLLPPGRVSLPPGAATRCLPIVGASSALCQCQLGTALGCVAPSSTVCPGSSAGSSRCRTQYARHASACSLR